MDQSEINHLLDLASAGSVDSTLKLFDFYLEEKDEKSAFEVLLRLKNSEDIRILHKFGNVYQNGIGVEKSLEKAIEFYDKAFLLGDYSAGFNIANIYYQNRNFVSALPYLVNCAQNNHKQSIKMLAEFYQKGLGVVKDNQIAINFYLKLLNNGDDTVLFTIAKIYYSDKMYNQAFDYFLKAFNQNEYKSCIYLSNCYMLGQGVNKSVEKAIDYLNVGCTHNDINCLKQLAIYYEKGIGVKKSLEKSKQLLNKIKIIAGKDTY